MFQFSAEAAFGYGAQRFGTVIPRLPPPLQFETFQGTFMSQIAGGQEGMQG